MNVFDKLRAMGGEQLVAAVQQALRGSEEVAETAIDEGVELKMVEGAVEEPLPSDQEQALAGEPEPRDEGVETTEKSARTFARQIEALADEAGERDAELLRALAVVVRRADPEQFGALAAILRKARGRSIQEEVDRIASRMEQESGIGYAYPEPEEDRAKSMHDELRAELEELRRVVEELRQKSAAIPVAGVSITRQPSPAAHLLFRAATKQ